jgi:alginate O-acetyltransferase complex protein AlgI
MKLFLAQLLSVGWTSGQGVTAGFDQTNSALGGFDVWVLGIGYGFQLFFDFAGYSLIAIGVARLFGIQLAQNFDRPFLSTTPAIFWTRWHMSLSFWIRDYVFRPLAAARRDQWWPYVALVVSMTLFGLWHGARWTYVVFGLYHGLLLVMHRLGQRMNARFPVRLPPGVGPSLAWGSTFALMSLGFVLFRANDLAQALSMFAVVASPDAYRRFAMPTSFYVLTIAAALGYFGFTAGQSLLLSCRARYVAAINGSARVREGAWQLKLANMSLILGGGVDFLVSNLWWWLAPAVISLSAVVGLAIYQQRAVIPVTPFIYTLF